MGFCRLALLCTRNREADFLHPCLSMTRIDFADHSASCAFSFNAGCADCRRDKGKYRLYTDMKGDPGMTKIPAAKSLLAGFVLLLGSVARRAQGKYAPGDMLLARLALAPKHDDVVLTIPTPGVKSCSVVSVQEALAAAAGPLLKDVTAARCARFFDSNGDGKVDARSYHIPGEIEIQREFDTAYKAAAEPNPLAQRRRHEMGRRRDRSRAPARPSSKGWRRSRPRKSARKNCPRRRQAGTSPACMMLFITEAETQAIKLSAQVDPQDRRGLAQLLPEELRCCSPARSPHLSKARFGATSKAQPASCFARRERLPRIDRHQVSEPACGAQDARRKTRRSTTNRTPARSSRSAWSIAWSACWSDKDPSTDPIGPPPVVLLTGGAKAVCDQTDHPRHESAESGVKAWSKDPKIEAYYRTRIALIQEDHPARTRRRTARPAGWQLFDNLASMPQNTGDQGVHHPAQAAQG